MKKINIKLENCYGIKKLEKEFDFSDKPAFILYASNGSMKTSFSKTLKDISNGESPKEEVFGRESTYKIENELHEALKPEEIFVIESYDANFFSKSIVEYIDSETSPDYILLTKLLHMINYDDGKKTKEICLQDLEKVINAVWKTDKKISTDRKDKSVYDLIINKKCSGTNKEILPILEEVSLMTAENIHLNSFMYEPLIDISIRHLKKLYGTLLPLSVTVEI